MKTKNMKAAEIFRFGGSDGIRIADKPIPSPGKGEVLVQVAWAAVNPLDWKTRSGSMKMVTGSKLPKALGSECAGLVYATGEGVTGLKPGDRVIGQNGMHGGAFADYFKLKERQCFLIPEGVSLREASCLYVTGVTARQCLMKHGNPGLHSRVLLIGASGGVGTMAVQLAKMMGAEVWAVCSHKNADYVRSLGADHVVDYNHTNIDQLSAESFDMIFDIVNVADFAGTKHLLKKGGLYMNTMPGPAVFFTQLRTSLFGDKKCKTYLMSNGEEDIRALLDMVKDRRLRIVIEKTYPLEQVAEAIEDNEKMRTTGKLLIGVNPDLDNAS